MRIENFLLGLVMFGIVILAGFTLFGASLEKYDSGGSSEVFNDFTAIQENISKLVNDVEDDTEVKFKDDDTEASIYKKALTLLKNAKKPIDLFSNVMSAISKNFNFFPSWLANSLATALIIMIVVFLLYMIMRFKPQ